MNRVFLSTLFLALTFCVSITSVAGAPGDLDRSFGTNGIVRNQFPNISDLRGTFLPDGKFVVMGSMLQSPNGQDFFIARFNANGSPDTSFDGDGQVTITISSREDRASCVAMQPDGKLIIGGSTRDENANYDLAVVRLNMDGSLDTSFDGDGIAILVRAGIDDGASSVAVQTDGKILLAGNSFVGQQKMMVARYNSNGTPDTSFDTDGVVITTFPDGASTGDALTIQPDGKAVVVGALGIGGQFLNSIFALARFNTNGTLDTSFGGDGMVTADVRTSQAQQNSARDVLVQPDGRIVAVGATNGGLDTSFDFAVLRLNPDGTPDTGFGSTGHVITSSQGERGDFAHTVALQSNGKLVVSGNSNRTDTSFMVVRYNSDGTIDPTFGKNGTTSVIDPDGSQLVRDIHIQSNGKIVTGSPSGSKIYLARFQANGVREADFDGDKRSDISVFRPSEGTWYVERSGAGFLGFHFGIATDRPVSADYDGDGRADFGVYRDGTWYIQNSTTGFTAANFGIAEDIPQPADYDGDGRSEIAVFRPSEGNWYVLNLANGAFSALHFGSAGDRPVGGDYDGDGKADHAVFRPSEGNWYIMASTNGFNAVHFGITSDIPVPADYDGDGLTDQAVYRNGTWFVNRSFRGFYAVNFGTTTDLPAVADFDGDGSADPSVFRPTEGNWYLLKTTIGFGAFHFGTDGDKPIPASIFR